MYPSYAHSQPTSRPELYELILVSSHGEFPCAGDRKALAFCRGIAEEMVRAFGIPRAEAVARINRQWSEPDAPGRVPRVWIVGLDLVYHETEAFWAADIYYGHGSFGGSRTLTPDRCHHPDKLVHAGFRPLSERRRTSASRHA
jgi:hypothetical protein